MNDPNPYVAPSAARKASPKGVNFAFVTWVFLGVHIVRASMLGVTYACAPLATALNNPTVTAILTTAWNISSKGLMPMTFLTCVVVAIWVYRSWGALPHRARKVRGKELTPVSAYALLAIPIFNFYWMFAMNLALCDAYETMATGRVWQRDKSSGHGLVWSAGGLLLLGLVGQAAAQTPLSVLQLASIASPIFWFLFMRHIDGLRSEIPPSGDEA